MPMRPSSHQYPFQGLSTHLLFTGTMDSGHQVLVGPWFPRSAFALRFSADGTLRNVDTIPLPAVTDRESLEQAVLESFFRIGAVPDTILMRRFSSEDPSSPLASVPGMAESVIQIIDLP